MKLIALIDDDEVIDLPAMLRLLAQASIALQAGKILRHLKLWPERPAPACMPGRSLSAKAGLSRAPPSIPPPDGGERIVEFCFDDPFPDYDTEPVYLSSEALA